jgi:chromodomain-helicase-DNA-binding protein 7
VEVDRVLDMVTVKVPKPKDKREVKKEDKKEEKDSQDKKEGEVKVEGEKEGETKTEEDEKKDSDEKKKEEEEEEKEKEEEEDEFEEVTHFLVKWRGLSYEESTWELQQDVDPSKVKLFKELRVPPPEDQRQVGCCVLQAGLLLVKKTFHWLLLY